MSDSGGRNWRLYVNDMIGFATRVRTYTQGLDQAAFVGNGSIYDATPRNLELILPERNVWS